MSDSASRPEPAEAYRVRARDEVFRGRIISVHADRVEMPGGTVATREVVDHPGAVAVVALDEQQRVVVVRQFRHPVRQELVELPAGLLDVPGEPSVTAARRELSEEARLRADDWHVLLDLWTSPGMSNEAIRVFLARGLHDELDPDFVPVHEEIAMTVDRVPLPDLVRAALDGELSNATAVAGVLACAEALRDPARLRAASTPWPARPEH